ncbi:Serine/threonine-protein kinase ATR [Abeliophyllum distichum]|uniref:non-specific serine/threonine protein kinase n=1 Tax=Abeliophyllum distichum TaxID=126358 RepID=A0ABD1TIR8_9LAMI
MANLSSLVHELRERIAASSSTPLNKQNDDALESRFRAVLPNLLHDYVVPSSSAKEREVVAVLKLLAHTAKNFPGVFYHGKASAVLPVIGRILPFFAEPSFRSRHGVIFETVGSLLSLLRTGDRDAYRQFFMDTLLLTEDLLYVASISDKASATESKKVSVKCFCDSFAGICNDTALLCDLPACSKPPTGYGIMIYLSGKQSWLPFATSAIKLLCKCLTEGTLYVEGLLDASSVWAVCTLLSYGDDDLHMACFDFIRLIGAGKNNEIVPIENLIQSMIIILSEAVEGVSIFRNAVYDSSLGGCLHALHSSCPDDIVQSTATELVRIFPESLLKTRSLELKVGLCSAYVRITKSCPPHIWRPEFLIHVLCSSKPIFPLIDCFKVAISRLGPDLVGSGISDENGTDLSTSRDNEDNSSRIGGKRTVEDPDMSHTKRQKIDDKRKDASKNCEELSQFVYSFARPGKKDYTDSMRTSLSLFVELLKPPGEDPNSLTTEVALTAISVLCIVFSENHHSNLSCRIFRQMCDWISWISGQAKQELPLSLDLPIFLEAVDCLLLLQGSLPSENNHILFKREGDSADLLRPVLKLSWNCTPLIVEPSPPWKAKCLSVRVLSRIRLIKHVHLDVLDLGLHDEAEEVRIESIISLPVIVLCSGFGFLTHMFSRLEILEKEKNVQVKKVIPLCIGYLACIYGACNGVAGLYESECKLYLKKDRENQNLSVDNLLRGFWCSKCDQRVSLNYGSYLSVLHLPNTQNTEFLLSCDFIHLQSLFFKLLYDESSEEEVQVACVGMIKRIILHGTEEILLKTRSEWVRCIDFLLLHRKKLVRQAFCAQISFFLEERVFNCLFSNEDTANKSKEQRFMDKIKHALMATEDPLVFETLLEAAAAIMQAVSISSQLYLFSLILLIGQLDSPYVTVRLTASKLIKRSCYVHHKGGFEPLLAKALHIRNELYDYLSLRLASRPKMVEEFAVGALGIETGELVKRMIPVVLPRLVVTLQDSDQAVATLYELAKCLNTDMVQLIVNWLPKVLALALHRADGRELQSALEFYHEHTGSDNQEIFAAALPALLDELVCFTDEHGSEDITKRLARVPQMIKEVAKILTGNEDLPGFLRNHFVGLLNSIDRKMLHAEDLTLQKQAITRIEMLINLMGSHLSTYVPKIMVLLMHAINKEWLQGEGLSVLHFFIKQLALMSPSSTKHNKVVLKEHIRELPPVPNIPALAEVNKAIQEARGLTSLKDQLRDVVDGLNHENLNVRYMVASELSKLLNLKREDVMALVTKEGDLVTDVKSSLITSLLKGCAEESRTSVGQRLKLICADCLGALGAVDPAKVMGSTSTRFKIACSDDDLIFELIHKHLARAFRAAPDTIIQDSAALAIQELLKFAGCEASLDENVLGSVSEPQKKPTLKVSKSSRRTDNDNEMYGRDNSTAVVHGINSGQSEVCIQAVFTLLDNLGQWVDDVEQELALSQSLQLSNSKQQSGKLKDQSTSLPTASDLVLVQCRHVSELLDAIPKMTLAKASFRCQAYARSLLYFESYVREKSGSFNPASERSGVFEDEDISFLMEIYSGLDEPDGLSGLACLRKSKSLQDHLLINKKAGNWAEVLTSCEQALQMQPTSVQRHSDVLNCLLNMCHLQAMVTHVDGLISRIPQYRKTWCMQGVQAAWRLGRWDLMDEYLTGADEEGLLCSSSESNALFDMDVAKILQAIMNKDQFSVAEKIALSKQSLIAPLAAAGMDSYARAYPFVLKLHMLRELEDFNSLLNGESFLERTFNISEPEFSKVLENWESRLKLTPPSLWAREPLLAFRRLVFGASGLGAQVGNCWIQYAKLCRSAGHYETSNRAILEAEAAGAPNVYIEKAKLLWSTRRADGAIAELQQSLLNMPTDVVGSAAISSITSLSVVPLNPPPLLCTVESMNDNQDVAKTLLLYSRWIHYTGQKAEGRCDKSVF